MNLPILGQLSNDESTYITFSKALLDLDEAIVNDTEYYFSKVVALNLPNWQNALGKMYADLGSFDTLGTSRQDNPNIVIPKMFQHYMENIMRQECSQNPDNPYIEEIAELAFWKTLNKLKISYSDIRRKEQPDGDSASNKIVVFANDIITSNFTRVENNNGWGEIICQIPNKCQVLTPSFRFVNNLKSVIVPDVNEKFTDDLEQRPIYDTVDGNYAYDFSNQETRMVLDFDKFTYDTVTKSSFKFNVLLLFYRDKAGIEKLHGIDFIYPFENKVSYWDQYTFEQKTNITQTIGYQFVFNLKTCNNEASRTAVYEKYEHVMWWNGFEKTLSGLNTFLEEKMRNDYISGIIN